MKVILLEDVKGLGKKGDVVNAADGHVRNFLLPKKLVLEATTPNMNALARQKEKDANKAADDLAKAQKIGEDLKDIVITLTAKAGDGKLFGSITSKDIVEALAKDTGIKIDKRHLEMADHIKSLGRHEVTVKLHPKVKAKLQVEIVAK